MNPRGPTTDSDHELWRRAAAGDRRAFGELFERRGQFTFLLACRKCADIRLVRNSALPWLYTVAGNLGRDDRRGKARFLRALRRVPDTSVTADHADEVAERLDSDARMARLLAAVRSLPRAEREAVELCLLGELPTADAADLLGVAEASVRSRISRARARLRTKLEEQP